MPIDKSRSTTYQSASVHPANCVCATCKARARARIRADTASQLALEVHRRQQTGEPLPEKARRIERGAADTIRTEAEVRATDAALEKQRRDFERAAHDPRARRLFDLINTAGLTRDAAIRRVDEEFPDGDPRQPPTKGSDDEDR
jgi:hypothetical protein